MRRDRPFVIALGGAAGLVACARIVGLEGSADPAPAFATSQDAARAAASSDATTASPGRELPRFEVSCNGSPLPPHACPQKRWETEPCPVPNGGARVVILRNEGSLPIAYMARKWWYGGYVPGEPSNSRGEEMVGTLRAGQEVDLSSMYNGGFLMLLGSVAPFSDQFVTAAMTDEGRIPYAKPIGDTPTTEMFIAQVTTIRPEENIGPCTTRPKQW